MQGEFAKKLIGSTNFQHIIQAAKQPLEYNNFIYQVKRQGGFIESVAGLRIVRWLWGVQVWPTIFLDPTNEASERIIFDRPLLTNVRTEKVLNTSVPLLLTPYKEFKKTIIAQMIRTFVDLGRFPQVEE